MWPPMCSFFSSRGLSASLVIFGRGCRSWCLVPTLEILCSTHRNPFNRQSLISHLTNSNGYGNLRSKVLLTVSPLRPSFSPRPEVFSRPFRFCSQQPSVRHAVSCSCRLFGVAEKVNSFVIKQIQTLCAEHPGGGYLGYLCFPAVHGSPVSVRGSRF
jgi:hypothetical protein